jgi:hypothetical protein
VYLAPGSIIGNTFVNDAAASTVGGDPPAVLDELVAEDECAAVPELLAPQPSTEQLARAAAAVAARR